MSHEMSHMQHVGARPFNHNQSQDAEREYDRLRDLARQEASQRSSCFAKSKQAYDRGDGAAAHQLSEEGKGHGAAMAQYNKQASEFIFRENNAEGRVPSDTIDLHGQFVEEAEDILEKRIRYAKSTGQTHLHVIVGKGNHSSDHIQKIKPRVEQICQQEGLQYDSEANEGRIYINLTGGPATSMPATGQGYSQPQFQSGPQQGYPDAQQQQYYGGQQQQQYGAGQGQAQDEDVGKLLKKFCCCVVM